MKTLEAHLGGRIGAHIVCCGVLLIIVAVAALTPRIAQPQSYHVAADTRSILGIPQMVNVLTCIPLLLVSALSLHRACNAAHPDRLAWIAVFTGAAASSAGSVVYHLSPSNATMALARVGVSIASTALACTICTARIRVGRTQYALIACVTAGLLSLLQWVVSEGRGVGDLRSYGLIQAICTIIPPLCIILYPSCYTGAAWELLACMLLVGSRLAEAWDAKVFSATSNILSGHSMHHLLLAAATYSLLHYVTIRRERSDDFLRLPSTFPLRPLPATRGGMMHPRLSQLIADVSTYALKSPHAQRPSR